MKLKPKFLAGIVSAWVSLFLLLIAFSLYIWHVIFAARAVASLASLGFAFALIILLLNYIEELEEEERGSNNSP